MRVVYSILLLCTVATAGCNSSEEITAEPPKIIFDDGTHAYTLKIGGTLELKPEIENGAGASFSWIMEDEEIGTGMSYIFVAEREGQFYITLRVTTKYGKDECEVRIDVARLAPPVISFAVADGRFDAVTGVEYRIEPVVRNGDDARYEWTLDGRAVGTEPSYVFRGETPGACSLKLSVTNEDGSAEKTIIINVADELPLKIYFAKPYYAAASTDIPVFAGRELYITPIVEGGGILSFEWTVDGQPRGAGRTLVFAADSEGEYDISVTVTSVADTELLPHTVTRVSAGAAASVRVVCRGEEAAGFRPATSSSVAACDRVLEYMPAPGQFINEPQSGFGGEKTLVQANAYAIRRLGERNYVSLGGFGGYLIVGFDHSIENRGGYSGYDFAIEGNQHDGGSEPGIVWVMQDVNGNGLPDDVWYELRGSETGTAGTIQDYAVTYVRPSGAGSAVPWFDNRGGSGSVAYVGAFHSQDYYYPAWVGQEAYTLRGTRLEARNREVNGQWVNAPYDWGYADNMGSDRLSTDANEDVVPVNVYFKISNAMNPDGSPAGLLYVDFIKIQTGVNAQSGWTGEISTEVFSIKDLNI